MEVHFSTHVEYSLYCSWSPSFVIKIPVTLYCLMSSDNLNSVSVQLDTFPLFKYVHPIGYVYYWICPFKVMWCLKSELAGFWKECFPSREHWAWTIRYVWIVFWFFLLLLKLMNHLKGIHACLRNKRDIFFGNRIKCQLKLSWLRVCFPFSGEQVIWVELWALYVLGEHFTTELHF